jgi:competence protein CoiA
MLTAIRISDNYKVLARDSEKVDGPFCCPKCGCETILRKGRVKIHHFAHKPPVFCEYGKGESDIHRKCKETIFDSLRQNQPIHDCELEKDFGKVVPDVFFLVGNTKVAIEVQISNLTMAHIIERTKEYNKLGIYVLWLPIFNDALNAKNYSPKQWEKWLHATYFGRVYYWIEGLSIAAIHFDEYQLYVEESSWYTEYGEEQFAGGYYRRSKRYRTPNHGPVLQLSQDFEARNRSAWRGGNIDIPACKILIDKHRPWWKS